MIESGSSLFYLLHCSTHDRLNTMTFRSFRNIPHGLHRQNPNRYWPRPCFASAHPARIASRPASEASLPFRFASAHPARIASFAVFDAVVALVALPQHIPHGLHQPAFRPIQAEVFLPQHIPHGLHRFSTVIVDQARIFASAHPARIASSYFHAPVICQLFCLSTSRTDCITKIAQMQCHKSTQYAVSW